MLVLAPYSGRGSTSQVLLWYSVLNEKTHGYVHAAGFKPIIHLMPERSTSVVLVQTLAEKWWDTTHTFHISGREMTITPHDFHYMTCLWFKGVPISLEDESGVRLGVNLLGRRYATEIIHYTDLEVDFMHRPQGMVEECLRMARAYLLFLVGVYLFANCRKMVSLR